MASLITDIGNAKLLVASPLNPVKIKSVVVGTGSDPFDSSIMSLQQQVWIGNASDPQKTLNNGLKFTTIIPSNVGSWTIQEWGLIDIEGDLIAYGQLDEGIYKQLGVMSIEPNFYIKLSSESETELVVTDSINFDHNALTNRNAVDSHPISSITGLSGSLQVLTNNDASIQSEIDLNKQVKTISANYTLTAQDAGSFIIDASAGAITITMPSATLSQAIKYIFLRTDASSNSVVIRCAGADAFYGEGATRPSGQIFQYETFTISKLNNSSWSLVRNSNSQLISSSGKPFFNLNGVVVGEIALMANMFGVGQTTQNLTSNRTQGVTYTNSTGRAIEVSIGVRVSTSGTSSLLRDGVSVGSIYGDVGSGGSVQGQLSAIIPNGSSYILNGGIIQTWTELR